MTKNKHDKAVEVMHWISKTNNANLTISKLQPEASVIQIGNKIANGKDK